MRELTDAEIRYLGDQGLGWLATVGEDGYSRVVPVAFHYNPEAGAIDIRGRGVTGRELFRDVRRTGVAALVLTAWACAGGAYVLLTLWRFLPITPEQLRYRLEREGTKEVLTGQVMGLWTVVIFVAAIIFTVVDRGQTRAMIMHWWQPLPPSQPLGMPYICCTPSTTHLNTTVPRTAATSIFLTTMMRRAPTGIWIFVYFALAIASTFGTTDVGIFGRDVRRSVMVHEILSFWFNVGVIATVVAFATS